jgi:hypothetical protein
LCLTNDLLKITILLTFEQQLRLFLACAFNKFRIATKRQPDFVDGCDEPANLGLHEFAESSDALTV